MAYFHARDTATPPSAISGMPLFRVFNRITINNMKSMTAQENNFACDWTVVDHLLRYSPEAWQLGYSCADNKPSGTEQDRHAHP